MNQVECDLLVIGSGAGGLAAAVTARKAGDFQVIVVEKEPLFGGTTAVSGGVLWIPCNSHAQVDGVSDTCEAARKYMELESGAFFDEEATDAFLTAAPQMVEWFERETVVKFGSTLYPDYHPTVGGAVDVGRSILAKPFDIRELGKDMARLRPPLATITFMGMMFDSSNAELKHFFRATSSLKSFRYVAKRLMKHLKELLLYRRGVNVTSGNALAARLAKSALALSIPIWSSSAARWLVSEEGVVRGAVISRNGVDIHVSARRGVVLACGGFSHDRARVGEAYPHLKRGGEHLSAVPSGNTGDGIRLAETVGGQFDIRFPAPAAWIPVSRVPLRRGQGVFPHLIDPINPASSALRATAFDSATSRIRTTMWAWQ